MKRAADEHDFVIHAGFSNPQDVAANARAFYPGNGVFDNDTFAGESLVEWPVSRLFAVGSPFGCSNIGVRLRIARKTTITENSRATRKSPSFKINAAFVVPSTGPRFA